MYKKEGKESLENKDSSSKIINENGDSKFLYFKQNYYILDYAYKLPFYSLWLYYVLKGRKFPYFYNFKEYSIELRMKQSLMIILGFWGINIAFNLYRVIKNENKNSE